MAPSAPRSISKSRERPPLPVRMETGRIEPSLWKPRSAVIFSSPGQSSCLSIIQDGLSWMIRRMTLVLQDPWDIGADRFDRLAEISHDLIVGPQRGHRRDHHAGRARLHDAARE